MTEGFLPKPLYSPLDFRPLTLPLSPRDREKTLPHHKAYRGERLITSSAIFIPEEEDKKYTHFVKSHLIALIFLSS